MRAQWITATWRLGAAGLLAGGLVIGLLGLPARAYTPEQVEAGAQVYARQCAGCHGARGEGGGPNDPDAPLLVGPRGLTGFRTAQDLYDFTVDTMPQDLPGSLAPEDYWAILAWLLAENGISGPGEPLGPATARGIALARR